MTEEALGLPVTTRDELVAIVERLPFELIMILTSRVQGERGHIRDDATAQLDLALILFENGELISRIRAFIEAGGTDEIARVVFSEQNMTALQRLLVLHARDDAGLDDLGADEIAGAKRALLAVPSVVESAETRLRDAATRDEEAAFAYTVQNGAYNEVPAPLNALVRTYEIFVALARASQHHEDACPIDDWFERDYQLSVEEQYAMGHGLHAAARLLDDEPNLRGRGVVNVPTNSALFRDKRTSFENLLTAERDWYADRFRALGEDDRSLAWERTPFLQRPFLRYSDGKWRVLSPRALASWLSDGFYHRALNSAQLRDAEAGGERSEWTLRFTRFFGYVAEQYALQLATEVFRGGAEVVSGEQTYGRHNSLKTTDVAIAGDGDLVLVEVVSARLSRAMQVDGNPVTLAHALERMVIKKARQLARVADDVLTGAVEIPHAEPHDLGRIFPVVVTAGGSLFQTDFLWDRIDPHIPYRLCQSPVEPLTLLGAEDLETLLGHVALGYRPSDLLAEKTSGPYRRLEFLRFQHDVLGTPNTTRPAALERRWGEIGDLVAAVLRLDP